MDRETKRFEAARDFALKHSECKHVDGIAHSYCPIEAARKFADALLAELEKTAEKPANDIIFGDTRIGFVKVEATELAELRRKAGAFDVIANLGPAWNIDHDGEDWCASRMVSGKAKAFARKTLLELAEAIQCEGGE